MSHTHPQAVVVMPSWLVTLLLLVGYHLAFHRSVQPVTEDEEVAVVNGARHLTGLASFQTACRIVSGYNGTTPSTKLFFVTGGNTFGSNATLGTQDAQPLYLVTSNQIRAAVLASGDVQLRGVGLQLADDDLSHRVRLKVPAAVTQDYDLVLPATDGATNELLHKTAAGLGWVRQGLLQTSMSELADDITTTSTTLSTLLSVSITTAGSSMLLVHFDASFQAGFNGHIIFQLVVDSAATGRVAVATTVSGRWGGGALSYRVAGLAAGSHTVRVDWAIGSGAGNLYCRPLVQAHEHATLLLLETTV